MSPGTDASTPRRLVRLSDKRGADDGVGADARGGRALPQARGWQAARGSSALRQRMHEAQNARTHDGAPAAPAAPHSGSDKNEQHAPADSVALPMHATALFDGSLEELEQHHMVPTGASTPQAVPWAADNTLLPPALPEDSAMHGGHRHTQQ